MSKINIQGTIDNIRSRSNVYTPLIEAVVNAIDSIRTFKPPDGDIEVVVKRDNTLIFDGSQQPIRSIEVRDNGIGFNQNNRDSFDELYSSMKRQNGGKGFGRFMYLKYFSEVAVESNYKDADQFFTRKFMFGRKDEIIINESNVHSSVTDNQTILYLNNLYADKSLDKELETIARKLLEKLLIFFINDSSKCPRITIKEADGSKSIVLNEYFKTSQEISLFQTVIFDVPIPYTEDNETFTAKVFKIYFPATGSKVILTADNREVVESSLHAYVPEFEDEFYDVSVNKSGKEVKRNYIVKTYVLGKYLDRNVSLERETFNFEKDTSNPFYQLSQQDIEQAAAEATKNIFAEDVKVRSEKKNARVNQYVDTSAPWHKTYIRDVDLSGFAYNASDEKIELELQKYKFNSEQRNKRDIQFLLNSTEDADFEERLNAIVSKITEIGKSDLAHYVSSRKVVLQVFEELRKRDDRGAATQEKEIHSLIFPMNRDSTNTAYEQHNLWLLDERLVFSEYVASDRKISKQKDALVEPDLVVFDIKKSYRNGENEYSNPLTIFEFKRPKRTAYKQDDDPILQIGMYLDKIRAGKYEMPEGTEPIKVNDGTPVYAYVVSDLTEKIHGFARLHQLTISADGEGYFGYHTGYKMYVEIISFAKLLKDATLRNKIFFKKLGLE